MLPRPRSAKRLTARVLRRLRRPSALAHDQPGCKGSREPGGTSHSVGLCLANARCVA